MSFPLVILSRRAVLSLGRRARETLWERFSVSILEMIWPPPVAFGVVSREPNLSLARN